MFSRSPPIGVGNMQACRSPPPPCGHPSGPATRHSLPALFLKPTMPCCPQVGQFPWESTHDHRRHILHDHREEASSSQARGSLPLFQLWVAELGLRAAGGGLGPTHLHCYKYSVLCHHKRAQTYFPTVHRQKSKVSGYQCPGMVRLGFYLGALAEGLVTR